MSVLLLTFLFFAHEGCQFEAPAALNTMSDGRPVDRPTPRGRPSGRRAASATRVGAPVGRREGMWCPPETRCARLRVGRGYGHPTGA